MKPRVDITEAGGKKWTMAKLVSDALGDGVQNNIFLSEFNAIPLKGSDDVVLAVLMKWACLVFEGQVVGPIEDAAVEVVEEAVGELVEVSPEQLGTDAVEYLAEVQALDVENIGYENTVALLADVKKTLDEIETMRKDLTKGARQTVEKINAKFKPAADRYKEAEAILKEKIIGYRADVGSHRKRMLSAGEDPPEPVPEVAGMTVNTKWEFLVDKNNMPLEFLMPDMAAIKAAFKKDPDRDIPGVIADRVETLAVEHKKVKR